MSVHPDDRVEIVPFHEVEDHMKQFHEYLKQGFEGAMIKNFYSNYELGRRSDQLVEDQEG